MLPLGLSLISEPLAKCHSYFTGLPVCQRRTAHQRDASNYPLALMKMAPWSVSAPVHCGPGACLIDPFQAGSSSLKDGCYISHHDFAHLTFGTQLQLGRSGRGSSANWKAGGPIRALGQVSGTVGGCRSRALVHRKPHCPALLLESFRARFIFSFYSFTVTSVGTDFFGFF